MALPTPPKPPAPRPQTPSKVRIQTPQGPAFAEPPPDPSAPTIGGAVAKGIEDANYANMPDEQRKALEQEKDTVKEVKKAYTTARDFDKRARGAYAIDRRYAAGTADLSWAVNTNLIGSMIDVLVSFLYARDPDVSVRKAQRVDVQGQPDPEGTDLRAFARTMEIVISNLWKRGKLKPNAKRMVRSTLSIGPGWLKAVMIADNPVTPEVQSKMNDLRDNIASMQALDRELDPNAEYELTPEQRNAKLSEQMAQLAALEQKTEVAIRKYMAFDFVAGQDVQVSLDVPAIEDYLDAEWVSFNLYRPKSALKKLFPRLNDEDCAAATLYYQRTTVGDKPLTDRTAIAMGDGGQYADEAEQYSTGGSSTYTASNGSQENGIPYIKIVERWNKVTNHIETWVDGVTRWAKEPFQPPYPSTRFYPCFLLTFYDVDGARHPQSLSQRLAKLQDEYARSRSNLRVARERSIPGVIFNGTAIGPDDAKKVAQGMIQEYLALNSVDPAIPLSNLFAAKPVGQMDLRLYDNEPILRDMEKVAGVQEALQSSVGTPKTATEASIQQSGFASRTTADRDMLETLLGELAQYTGECALSALTTQDAQRIAGPGAFWPHGMALDDLLTLVAIDIEAGTTGKPRADADQAAWGVILPQLKEAILGIRQAQMAGDLELAEALTELTKETMLRMGDDTDVSRFIPEPPPPLAPPAIDPITGLPVPPDAGMPPGGPAGGPPGALPGEVPGGPPATAATGPAPGNGGAPPLANPTLAPPDLQPPNF